METEPPVNRSPRTIGFFLAELALELDKSCDDDDESQTLMLDTPAKRQSATRQLEMMICGAVSEVYD